MEEKWENISLDERENRMRLNKNCAMRMMVIHGSQAHLIALMNLHYEEETGVRKSGVDWREVMKQMDELKGWKECKD
jgi:predicted SprT family Zn-dependent metalloprotease